jgi:hypothetical protein
MTKATYYLGIFLAGCVATSLLGTVATLHPAFFRFVLLVEVVRLTLWLAAWALDDWLIALLKCDRMFYYGSLISLALSTLLGAGVALWMNW